MSTTHLENQSNGAGKMINRNIGVFPLQVKRFCSFMQTESARFSKVPQSLLRVRNFAASGKFSIAFEQSNSYILVWEIDVP